MLKYINNKHVRFQTFVANRLEFIHSGSDITQWHHIEGKLNPADYASRGLNVKDNRKAQVWFNGPEFLMNKDLDFQNTKISLELDTDDTEVKKHQFAMPAVLVTDFMFERFSSFDKLTRAVGWIFRFFNNVKRRVNDGKVSALNAGSLLTSALSVTEVKEAEIKIFQSVQEQYFQETIASIKQGKQI